MILDAVSKINRFICACVVNHFLLSKRLVITLVSRDIRGFIKDLKSSKKLVIVIFISAAGRG